MHFDATFQNADVEFAAWLDIDKKFGPHVNNRRRRRLDSKSLGRFLFYPSDKLASLQPAAIGPLHREYGRAFAHGDRAALEGDFGKAAFQVDDLAGAEMSVGENGFGPITPDAVFIAGDLGDELDGCVGISDSSGFLRIAIDGRQRGGHQDDDGGHGGDEVGKGVRAAGEGLPDAECGVRNGGGGPWSVVRCQL